MQIPVPYFEITSHQIDQQLLVKKKKKRQELLGILQWSKI